MDPTLLIVGLFLYWILRRVLTGIGRSSTGGEASDGAPGPLQDGVSSRGGTLADRALEALRRWEQEQRRLAGEVEARAGAQSGAESRVGAQSRVDEPPAVPAPRSPVSIPEQDGWDSGETGAASAAALAAFAVEPAAPAAAPATRRSVSPALAVRRVGGGSRLRELSDLDALRRAIVWREILGPPLALRAPPASEPPYPA